jgi:hypothetical protein
MNTTLLLDVDGVLIRDRVLLNHVKSNVIRYVSKKLPGKNASRLNNQLYKEYGHTAIGLEKEYGIDTSDFNRVVYNSHVLEHLYDFLDSKEFEKDAMIVRDILNLGHDVQLFSNSPIVWSLPVALTIDDRIQTGTYMKPKIESYLQFDQTRDYVFVDDKICNLMPVLFLENWKPVHFSPHREMEFMKTIDSLEDLL